MPRRITWSLTGQSWDAGEPDPATLGRTARQRVRRRYLWACQRSVHLRPYRCEPAPAPPTERARRRPKAKKACGKDLWTVKDPAQAAHSAISVRPEHQGKVLPHASSRNAWVPQRPPSPIRLGGCGAHDQPCAGVIDELDQFLRRTITPCWRVGCRFRADRGQGVAELRRP